MNMYAIGRMTRLGLVVLAVGLSVATSEPVSAQTANFPPGTPKAPAWSHLPDWSGIWERGGDIVWDDSLPNTPGEPQVPPYNEKYMKEYQDRRAEMRAANLAGRPRNFRGGGLYASMPSMMIMLFPMDIQINPREVVIMTSNGGEREIYTDGRLHPVDALPSTKGHSIGRWEGKTLVVDTCCFKEDTRLMGGGAHSDEMHVLERIWSPDGHSLKDAIVVEDPKAFTKPWTTEKTYYRRPDWEQVEYDPDENTRDFPGAGAGGAQLPPGAQPPPGAPGAGGVAQPVRVRYDDDKPYAGRDAESLQKATAFAAGNLAWETVKLVNVERSASQVKWVGLTRSARWRCTAAPDVTKAVCENALMPLAVAAVPATLDAKPATTESPLIKNRISVDGRDRSYSYYVSSKVDKKGFNFIVYALHDNGQTAEEFAEQSGWKRIAEKNGFVVVFPEAVDKTWAPDTGAEDHYLKAVYDDASTHMLLPAGEALAQNFGPHGGADAAGGGEPPNGGAAGGAGRRRGEGGEAPNAEGGGNRRNAGPPRVMTWFPFQYLAGVGAGGRVAQEFAIDYPGVYAALATLNATPFSAIYARGNEPAQGYFQEMRFKNASPVWKQLKKDVPVAVWLFNSREPGAAGTKLANYWRQVDRVSSDGSPTTVAGFNTTIYRNSGNPAQQLRMSTLPASFKPDETLASAIWSDFFSHVARWTSSPNGDLGTLLTQAEIKDSFDIRAITVDGKPYKYYLQRPSGVEKGKPLPLVIAAHGFGYPAWLYLSQIKMHEIGAREGFLTAYIDGPAPGWEFTAPDSGDAQFVQKVIAEAEQTYGADPGRIYMQGFSLGSGLTYMMGITHPRLFAAISPNSGIGPMSKEVEARIAAVKAESDIRIPTLMVYGDVDSGGSIDGQMPAQGVIRGAFDELKTFNHITTQDRTERFNSDNVEPYDVLVPGAKVSRSGSDKRYPRGRFEIYRYLSADPAPLNLFSFVWVEDMAHGGDPRQAQLEWDYFKRWHRNADGSLSYTSH